MSILIDEFINKTNSSKLLSTTKEIDGKWYIAKAMPYYSFKNLLLRIADAFRVLSGKSMAVHYKEDEVSQ